MGSKCRQFNNPVTKLQRAATTHSLSPIQQLKVLRRSQRVSDLFMCFCPVAALNEMGGRENGRKSMVMLFLTTREYLENDPFPPSGSYLIVVSCTQLSSHQNCKA